MIDNIAEVETFRELTGTELDIVGGGVGFDLFGAIGGAILGGLLGATYGPQVGGSSAGPIFAPIGALAGLIIGVPAAAFGGFWFGSQSGEANILGTAASWLQNIVNTPIK